MDQYNLSRFIVAQETTHEGAMLELARGRKDSHWIWYVFPQIEGLGESETTRLYSIKSLEEGKAYLKHPVLGSRLIKACEILVSIEAISINEVMGFPDNLKLLSSMTLFEFISDENSIFNKIIKVYFDNNRDENSLRIIHTML